MLEDLPENVNRRRRDEAVEWEAIEPIVGEAAARYGYCSRRESPSEREL